MHAVSRLLRGTQAKCVEAGPGSESRAEAYGGILGSWESPHRSLEHYRKRTIPVHQRPGAWAAFPAAFVSETRETKETASEGNRSGRVGECGSRSGLIVAIESRRTNRREPGSSEGDHRGEEGAIGRDAGEILPQSNVSPRSRHIASVSESSPRRTGCVNCARPGLWGSRRATAGTTRQNYPTCRRRSPERVYALRILLASRTSSPLIFEIGRAHV